MKKKFFRALGVLLSVIMLFSLAACGSKDKKEETKEKEEAKTQTEEKTEEKKEEEKEAEGEWTHENRGVVTNLESAASTSSPFAHANLNDRKWLNNCYEALFCYNGLTGEREPRVGKSVEISEDGLVYTVEIFDNVYFQNGKHCTAEDVKRSYEYGKESAFNLQFSGVVDHVEVVDDYTVDIVLKEPSSPFLTNSDQIFILDMDEVEEQGEDFGTIANKAGTGAYYIEKYDPAVEIILKRHENFHRTLEDKRPIPEITFKVLTDLSAAVIAFESGNLDFLEVQPSNFADIEASGKYNTYLGQTTQSNYFAINANKDDPLANKLVRQALAYAIDYESVLEASVEGYGEAVGKFAYPEMTIAAPPRGSNTVYTYNPEKAKELLAEAGYADGVDIGAIKTTAGISHEKMAQVIQQNFADVGVTVTLDLMEQVTMISDARDGNYDAVVMGYYMMMDYDYFTGIIDFDGNNRGILKIDGASDIDYEDIFRLFAEGRKHTDEEERRAIYTELDALLMDGAVIIPLLHTALPYAWDKDLYIETNKPYTYHFSQFWNCYWE